MARGTAAAPKPPFEAIGEPKINVPVLRTGLVSRTALVNRLRAERFCSVVAVTAPAGYGKTTVLAQWAARDPRPFAWVSLDECDGDPMLLLRHVGAALHELEALEPHVLEAFAAPGPSMWGAVLPRLVGALDASKPLVLVLDDAHLLRTADSIDAVGVIADSIPVGSALVLSGRVLPNLSFAGLRATGKLLEVGVEQLALTTRESQLLLRSTGADLSFEDVTTLVRECEGWAAALYLAARSSREKGSRPGGGDGQKAIPFAGRDSSLAEYFRSEYLSRLRPDTVQFLRRTSILEQMCGALCDAVLGRRGSARTLERIEGSNLFLVPLDRERVWYRYHHLFRDALRRELSRREPDLVAGLHRRAADWYEAHDDPESALEHARAARDMGRVVRLFTTIALPLYHSGRAATVERWLARFDDAKLLERYPAVALQGSWIHALRGRPADAERWLASAEVGLGRTRRSHESAAWIGLIRAALCGDGVYQMIADAEIALRESSRDHAVRPPALLVLGAGYMLLGQNGRADAILAEAAAEAERLGATETQVVALGERSIIAADGNDAGAAERLALEARSLVAKGSLEGYGTTAIALATAARTSLRHGHWDEARADLDRVGEIAPSMSRGLFPWFVVQTRLEFARVYLALRETRAVRSLLAEIRELLREHPYVGVLVDEVDALERDVDAMPERGGAGAAFTPAELRLLPFLATHLSFREIGEQLYVSRNTIKTQAISVYRKLGVTSRSEAITRAAHLGLLETDAPPA